jgi:hypothetical protein
MQAMSSSLKRTNGIYYTPAGIARAIARWAIQHPHERILDPCYGGCAFLDAGREALQALGADNPDSQLWGVDVDPDVQAHVNRFISCGAAREQFITADFLTMRPEMMIGAPFEVVLANPPYVRHHLLNPATAKLRADLAKEAGADISGRASHWAYFVVHLMTFIASGGRAAFVLPGSLLTADYADEVRHVLVQSFCKLTAILVEDRLFQDTQEATVLVFGEGRGGGPAEVRVGIATRGDVATLDAQHLPRLTQPLTAEQKAGRWLSAVVNPTALAILRRLATDGHAIELGQVASISIGTVTGRNAFFIIRPSLRRELNLPENHVRPLVTHVAQLPGLRLTSTDIVRLVDANQQVLLITVSAGDRVPHRLKAYFDGGEQAGISQGYKCRRRTPWYAVPVTSPPDAFLPYMGGHAPRMVINDARVSCTNTILGVRWTTPINAESAKALALGSLSAVTQLSAELIGRSYGGGVLKLEPSDAARLLIPRFISEGHAQEFEQIHQLLLQRNTASATELIDRSLERAGVLGPSEAEIIQQAIAQIQRWRLGAHTSIAE